MSDCLPWDIIVEILSRLPVESLLRFKCVSKSFDRLISQDAYFKKKHLHQSNYERAIVRYFRTVISCHPSSLASDNGTSLEPDNGTAIEGVTGIDVPVFLLGNSYSKGNISNSCDGLFCLSDNFDCVIWNPHTKESKRIPHCTDPVGYTNARYGLAYDSVSDDYKVIGEINVRRFPHLPHFSIYSLKTCSPWRKIKDDFPCKYFAWEDNYTVMNGSFHWIAHDERHSPFVLISLDVANEKFNKFALPSPLACRDPRIGDRKPVSCVLRNKLCIFHWTHYGFDLWTMEEYGVFESLRKTLSVSAGTFARFSLSKPMYMFEDGTIIMYDRHNERFDQMSFYKDGRLVERGIKECAYVSKETMISPHMSTA